MGRGGKSGLLSHDGWGKVYKTGLFVMNHGMTTNVLFTKSIGVSGNASAEARMGAKLIDSAAVVLPLMRMLCVNRFIHCTNVPLKRQRERSV